MSDTVLLDQGDGVAIITLNRPESMNACSAELKTDLLTALRNVNTDDSVRAVVLTGAGKAFCVGQDLREHADHLATGTDTPMQTVVEHYNPISRAIAGMPKPVVAAVNGMAAGAGASFAFAADLRIAAEDAAFLMAFANVGLSVDSGASYLLQRIVGSGRATAMCLLAEPVSAQSALDMGLVNAVLRPDKVLASAVDIAARLAAGPTAAYAAIKESLAFAASSTFDEALEKEAEMQARTARTADHRAAVTAFLAKDRPAFSGR